jgi:hypothetical protein
MRCLVVLLGLAQAGTASAQASISVTLNDQGRDVAQELGLSVPDLIAHFESRIDELYRVSRIENLLGAFADAAAFTQRGLGADYDVDAGDILIGGSASGVHGDVAIGTTDKLLGGSFYNFTLFAGANLGRWKHPRWTTFASGFYHSMTIRGLQGHLLTLGGHVQYQLVQPTKPGNARWTGIAATTGIEYARWTVGMVSTIDSRFRAEGPNDYRTIQMDSTGTLDVLTSTLSVPIELTTGVRLLRVLSLYGGGGIALTTGDSTITARLESVLSINSDHLPIGNAVITGSGESTPSVASAHALAGIAIHTRYVRVFLQGAFAPSELSVSLGLRIAP